MRNSRGTLLSVLSFQLDSMETFHYLDKMYIYQLDNGKSNKENDSSLNTTNLQTNKALSNNYRCIAGSNVNSFVPSVAGALTTKMVPHFIRISGRTVGLS